MRCGSMRTILHVGMQLGIPISYHRDSISTTASLIERKIKDPRSRTSRPRVRCNAGLARLRISASHCRFSSFSLLET